MKYVSSAFILSQPSAHSGEPGGWQEFLAWLMASIRWSNTASRMSSLVRK